MGSRELGLTPQVTLLSDAKQFLRKKVIEEGKAVNCPCCDQNVKVYKRKLNDTMVKGLVWLHHQGEGWIEVNKIAPRWLVSKGGTLATLAHWKLIEQSTEKPIQGGRTSGIWRTTEIGREFAKGQIRVPRYVRLYNGKCLGLVGEDIGIKEVLGDHFDYQELMRA